MEMLLLLLEAGADVNAPAASDGGQTALQAATDSSNTLIVEQLKTAGARK
jgi:ankyrin repeat protein